MNTTATYDLGQIVSMYAGALPWDPSRLPKVSPEERAATECKKRRRVRAMFGEEAAPPPETVRIEDYVYPVVGKLGRAPALPK